MSEQLPTREDVAATLSGEQRRTVALEHDMPRVREWLDQSVRHAVNEAAQAFNAIRYWCDEEEQLAKSLIDAGGCSEDEEPCPLCLASYRSELKVIAHIRTLLPDLPAVPERRAESGREVTGMAGTRVTRDRDFPVTGGGDDEAAFGGNYSGNYSGDDRDF